MRRQQSMGGPVPHPAGSSPHQHPQAHRHRHTGALPPEQARAVRSSEGRCNGCRREFPFRFLEVEHIIPPRGKWPGQYRELAAALCPLQSGEGRLASGVRNDQAEGVGDSGVRPTNACPSKFRHDRGDDVEPYGRPPEMGQDIEDVPDIDWVRNEQANHYLWDIGRSDK